jgi:hypothetical protein
MTFTNKKSSPRTLEFLPKGARLACKLAQCTLAGERFVVAIEIDHDHGEWVSIPNNMLAVMQAATGEPKPRYVRAVRPEVRA